VTAGTEVLLLCMPWNSVLYPSLGLSLLSGRLESLGVPTKLRYLNIRFAEMIGTETYLGIAHQTSYELMADWVFSQALFGIEAGETEEYIECVLRSPPTDQRTFLAPKDEATIRAVRTAREAAEGFLDICLSEIVDHRPRMIGFSCLHHQLVASLALATRIKDLLPKAFVVFGGPSCEGIRAAELVRRFSFIDAVVSGDGDSALPELALRVLGRTPDAGGLTGVYTPVNIGRVDPAGRYPNADPELDLDRLPIPNYDDFFMQLAESSVDQSFEQDLLMETSRGCNWGRCTFCSLGGAGQHYRLKTSKRSIEEITHLVTRYPNHVIHLTDITIDRARFDDLVPALAALDMPVEIVCHTRCDLTKKQLQALRDAGFTMITFGIESLSTPLLDLMRKGVTALENIQILKWCMELGVDPDWNILWGFAGEQATEYQAMADLVPLLVHLSPPLAFGRIHVDRFSPCFAEADRMGFADLRPSPAYRWVLPLPDDGVANLATYFTYRYDPPQDVESYTDGLRMAIEEWRARHTSSSLEWADDGKLLRILDRRPMAQKADTILSGVHRELYLACGDVQTQEQLLEIAGRHNGRTTTPEELGRLIWPLIDSRLLLEDTGRFLGLALPGRASSRRGFAAAIRLEEISNTVTVSATEVGEAVRRKMTKAQSEPRRDAS
jgi:ribosomal peptide maturation radical SAM protein 1